MVCTISNSNYANMYTSQLYTKKEIIFQIIFLILINYDTTHDNMHYIARAASTHMTYSMNVFVISSFFIYCSTKTNQTMQLKGTKLKC